MSDASIRISVETDTQGSVEKLDAIKEASREAGEAVDTLDAKTVDVETGPAVAELDAVTTAAQTADAQTVVVDVDASAAGPAATQLDTVTASGGQAQGVMSNLTGNAAQDLAGVAGVSGSAGTALGQLAERASEGGIALRQMGGATAGIAGIGVAIEYVTSVMQTMKDADTFDTKKVEEYRDAILDGVGALEALQAALTEAKGVSVREVGEAGLASLPWGDKTVIKDITDDVVALGLDVKSFSELATSSTETIKQWGAEQVAAGQDAQQVGTVVMALHQEHSRLTKAQDASKVSAKFLNQEMSTTGGLTAQAAAVNNLVRAYRDLAAAQAAARVADAAATFDPATYRGGRQTTINYYPPAPTPLQVAEAEREYQRIHTGPVAP